jgi:osmoprotectant transport system substrate-binding protein
MRSHRWTSLRTLASVVVALLAVVACSGSGSGSGRQAPGASGNGDPVTVGSFNFDENQLLAELYSQALEGGGFQVRRAFDLGPREFVAPALAGGLVDLVPEYAGTALQFLSLGSVQAGGDVADTHRALVQALASTPVTALAPAPAQDANTFVVTRRTAELHGLRTLSDVAAVAPQLTFGGPPECSTRPFCLLGLERVYGLRFKEVVSLDAGGPLTRQALSEGAVDMALLFTTDPAIEGEDVVELVDDRDLRPAENVTPLVRTQVVDRGGPKLVTLVDAVSGRLTTDDLRGLNALVAGGADVGATATSWLKAQGLR